MKERIPPAARCHSRALYVILFCFILLVMNFRQARVTNFGCEICSDKAGYFMYLPAVFHYGFDAGSYPAGADKEHGMGFTLDEEKDRVVTKFTYGVALLQAPFYGYGVLMARWFSLPVDPFSRYFLMFLSIGASLYAVAGLYFFRKWLDFYTGKDAALATMLLVFFGTHLYYYTLDESLMGHLYSFSLFSMALYEFKAFSIHGRYRQFLLFALAVSVAILIRPTNVLFIVFILLLDIRDIRAFTARVRLLAQPRYLLAGLAIFLVVMLPQLIYWKYAFGRFLFWSYQGEGFYFWDSPKLMLTWFSTQSGLFPYTPMVLVGVACSIWMIFRRLPNGWLVLAAFLIVSYMCASWSNPFFGECNFGKRPFVEYLPLMMLPLATGLHHLHSFPRYIRKGLYILIGLFVVHNLGMFVVFHTCFPGGVWDWPAYLGMLKQMALLDKLGI